MHTSDTYMVVQPYNSREDRVYESCWTPHFDRGASGHMLELGCHEEMIELL